MRGTRNRIKRKKSKEDMIIKYLNDNIRLCIDVEEDKAKISFEYTELVTEQEFKLYKMLMKDKIEKTFRGLKKDITEEEVQKQLKEYDELKFKDQKLYKLGEI